MDHPWPTAPSLGTEKGISIAGSQAVLEFINLGLQIFEKYPPFCPDFFLFTFMLGWGGVGVELEPFRGRPS